MAGCARACVDAHEAAPSNSYSTTQLPNQDDQSALELRVLEALNELDGGEYRKAVGWHLDSDIVVVIIFAGGDTLSTETLSNYEERALEVAGGLEVTVEVDAGSGPTAQSSPTQG